MKNNLIIDHGHFNSQPKPRKRRKNSEAIYIRVWGVVICTMAIILQVILGAIEFLGVTCCTIFIGGYLLLYSREITREYKRIRRERA